MNLAAPILRIDEKPFDRLSCAELHWPTDRCDHFLFVVDTQTIENRRIEVGNLDGICWVFRVSRGIGFADHNTLSEAAPPDQTRKPVRPMIATFQWIDVWRSAEFSDHQHDGRLQQV